MWLFNKVKNGIHANKNIVKLQKPDSSESEYGRLLICKSDCTHAETDLDTFEKDHNIKIPQQYRAFLVKYNGGETANAKFQIATVSSDIRGFYGFTADSFFNYNHEFSAIFIDFLSQNMLPIATNVFGDYILIGLAGKSEDAIFFYYHDRETKYIKLTDDFYTFVQNCKSKRLGHIPTIQERTAAIRAAGFPTTPQAIAGWQAEIDRYEHMEEDEVIL